MADLWSCQVTLDGDDIEAHLKIGTLGFLQIGRSGQAQLMTFGGGYALFRQAIAEGPPSLDLDEH